MEKESTVFYKKNLKNQLKFPENPEKTAPAVPESMQQLQIFPCTSFPFFCKALFPIQVGKSFCYFNFKMGLLQNLKINSPVDGLLKVKCFLNFFEIFIVFFVSNNHSSENQQHFSHDSTSCLHSCIAFDK